MDCKRLGNELCEGWRLGGLFIFDHLAMFASDFACHGNLDMLKKVHECMSSFSMRDPGRCLESSGFLNQLSKLKVVHRFEIDVGLLTRHDHSTTRGGNE